MDVAMNELLGNHLSIDPIAIGPYYRIILHWP